MFVILRAARLVAVAIVLVPSLTMAQQASTDTLLLRVDSLQRRIVELERRVTELEALLKAGASRPQAATAAAGPRDPANWRRIRHRLAMDAVRELLGEPESVSAGPSTVIWGYPGGGSVTFVASRVEAWTEPRR